MPFTVTIADRAYAFIEIAETVRDGLRRLGHAAELAEGEPDGRTRSIVIAPHRLPPNALRRLPPGTILYNFEPLPHKAIAQQLAEAVRDDSGLVWWDYSARNVAHLRAMGLRARALRVPLGHHPGLAPPPAAEKDIDVLFYGSLNQRRYEAILRVLPNVRFVYLHHIYGPLRDRMIAAARVVLNAHYYESGIIEAPRLMHLLALGKAVVSECRPGTEHDPWMEEAMVLCPHERLADACRALLADEERRVALERRGLELVRRQDEAAILERALAES